LRTISALITLTWPAARPLALNNEHAEILDEDAEERRSLFHALRMRPGKQHLSRPLTDPAPKALIYAANSMIADKILTVGHDKEALAMLEPIHAQLATLDGSERALGGILRGSPWSSLPLRVILGRKTEVTPTLLSHYLGADEQEFRRAAR
jgi:hypothetical protein